MHYHVLMLVGIVLHKIVSLSFPFVNGQYNEKERVWALSTGIGLEF
jgi:hypothetical protein